MANTNFYLRRNVPLVIKVPKEKLENVDGTPQITINLPENVDKDFFIELKCTDPETSENIVAILNCSRDSCSTCGIFSCKVKNDKLDFSEYDPITEDEEDDEKTGYPYCKSNCNVYECHVVSCPVHQGFELPD